MSNAPNTDRLTTLTEVERVELKKWDEIHQYGTEPWIFRGIKKYDLALETALERNGIVRDGGIAKLKERELVLLTEFQRRYQHYSHHTPHKDDTLEWLSAMQHHGAPTRLLDWSYSIYVAAYFALEEAEEDCAVWAINRQWIFDQLEGLYEDCEHKKFLTKSIEDSKSHRSLFKEIFQDKVRKPFIASFTPFRLNERLTIQKGTFLIPSDLTKRFEDNLSEMTGYDRTDNIKRIIIPRCLHREAIRSLYYMNISRATLYPGLDGFASSLGIFHPRVDT